MNKTKVSLQGVCSDLGGNIEGSSLGPAAIRQAGLVAKLEALGLEVNDLGDLTTPTRSSLIQEASAHYLPTITTLCKSIAQSVKQSMQRGEIPLFLGGDHSLAIGSFSGARDFYAAKGQSLGLIWFDAHADINTPETTPSGNLHGMPVATILGHGFPELTNLFGASHPQKFHPKNTVLIGLRDLDPEEKEICRQSGIRAYSSWDIERLGINQIMDEAITFALQGTSGFHLSIDLDGVDPIWAPGVSTPALGGLTYREICFAMQKVANTRMLTSMDVVELNPKRDLESKTARLAVDLFRFAFGERAF